MRIVVAPDSFKESMTAATAAAAMVRGVLRVLPDADVVAVPMADGGEGTVDAVVAALGGRLVDVATTDALGRAHAGRIGVVGELAVIEVADAVGLALIAPADRDVMAATSRGVADLVLAALDGGARRLLIGLGGSATNDGGAGLLVGLGARLLDDDGAALDPQPGNLARVAAVDLAGLDPRLAGVAIELACDVTSPLLGPGGASAVFGPQKGADPGQVSELEAALAVLVDALERAAGHAVRDVPGAGAAGGLGTAFLALGATRRRGVDVVVAATGLARHVAGADLVLTGEGSIDAQTLAGKVPAGVAEVAALAGVPVLAFAGRVDPAAVGELRELFAAVVPLQDVVTDLPDALRRGPELLELAVADAVRQWLSPRLSPTLSPTRGGSRTSRFG